MITRAAIVPHPPFLLPGVTGRPVPEVETLRESSATAVRWVLDRAPDVLVLLGGATVTGTWRPAAGSPVARYAPGVRTAPGGLPLSLAVAACLLPETEIPVTMRSIAFDAGGAETAGIGVSLAEPATSVGMVVVADGSARRGVKAPGHLDERAATFDDGVSRAVRAGDVAALQALDADLASELLVSGRAALQVMAGAFAGRAVEAHLDYEDDPFGVRYTVARWEARRGIGLGGITIADPTVR